MQSMKPSQGALLRPRAKALPDSETPTSAARARARERLMTLCMDDLRRVDRIGVGTTATGWQGLFLPTRQSYLRCKVEELPETQVRSREKDT